MAGEVDPTIRLAMDQGFADGVATVRSLGAQALQQSNFVNQQVQLSHTRVVGAFEAKAVGNLEQEGIADAVLQGNAARDQPGQNTKA